MIDERICKENKKILIINSGGTICMKVTETGYAPDAEAFNDTLKSLPELHNPKMPYWDIINMEPLLDSSNIMVDEWNKIGGLIEENYEAYDGFVILHGTDTMAYTASALSFMLENLGKPVIITGAQIPLGEIRSDGKDNLISSLMMATSGKVFEVCICFANKLFRGNRTVKYSSSDLIAFNSPNYPPLATVGINIEYNMQRLLKKPNIDNFSLQRLKKIPIGVIKVFPGIQFELFESIMTESLKGIVIETFGAGNIPSNSTALVKIIDKAYKNGTIITVCTQCPQGTVLLGAYETSSALKKVGAVSGKGMTTEAAVAKLYYLFSKELSSDEIRRQMEISLRGEEA